jgi:hypothetical protein
MRVWSQHPKEEKVARQSHVKNTVSHHHFFNQNRKVKFNLNSYLWQKCSNYWGDQFCQTDFLEDICESESLGGRLHQENLKFLNRTWGALNRVLRTFQGRFFQGESRQVVSLILCLVHLENFLMLLIVCIWLMCSLLILAYLGVLKECLYICAHLKMGLGLT